MVSARRREEGQTQVKLHDSLCRLPRGLCRRPLPLPRHPQHAPAASGSRTHYTGRPSSGRSPGRRWTPAAPRAGGRAPFCGAGVQAAGISDWRKRRGAGARAPVTRLGSTAAASRSACPAGDSCDDGRLPPLLHDGPAASRHVPRHHLMSQAASKQLGASSGPAERSSRARIASAGADPGEISRPSFPLPALRGIQFRSTLGCRSLRR